MGIAVRPAVLADAPAIHELLRFFAARHLLLARNLGDIYEHLRDFLVAVDDHAGVQACAALHLVNDQLAEVKSLAVAEASQGLGLGRMLVERACQEAQGWGLQRVFCLTYQVAFFEALGFHRVDRSRLPDKVWNECVRCDRFLDCDEVAMWRHLHPAA